ncbi:MAG TPA: DUF364 domain-containing protein, partial [Telmatospirillum sp.]|nr:DUF364 domain-containing protein [Telmatospirillum sp.]
IAAVPADSVVQDCLVGLNWILVRSDRGLGIAMQPHRMPGSPRSYRPIAGMKTRDLAKWSKSWDFLDAAIGLAAINSVLNDRKPVEGWCGRALDTLPDINFFEDVPDDFKGRKVAVVGHFYGLESLAQSCTLSVLERLPRDGDLPDPACEYILPEQDIVIMTATTLINKTMPRLLQLSRNARVIVCGPTTPLTPLMFGHGVDMLAGFVVTDHKAAWLAVQEGAERELLAVAGSRMVQITAPPRADITR